MSPSDPTSSSGIGAVILISLSIAWNFVGVSCSDEVYSMRFSSAMIYIRSIVTGKQRDRKSTRLNSSHITRSRMPSSA